MLNRPPFELCQSPIRKVAVLMFLPTVPAGVTPFFPRQSHSTTEKEVAREISSCRCFKGPAGSHSGGQAAGKLRLSSGSYSQVSGTTGPQTRKVLAHRFVSRSLELSRRDKFSLDTNARQESVGASLSCFSYSQLEYSPQFGTSTHWLQGPPRWA